MNGDGLDCPVSRRETLTTVVGGSLVALAGCLGLSGEEEIPDPVALDQGQACDQCNMVIERHPGPVGQSYYLDDVPPELEDREDGRAHFCSTWCMYRFNLDQSERGYEVTGSYGTDYSSVEYELDEDAGAIVIDPTPHPHLGPDSFERVSALVFVVDSEVEGSMGPSLIGFSDEADASAFADEYGGELLEDGEITLELITAMGN